MQEISPVVIGERDQIILPDPRIIVDREVGERAERVLVFHAPIIAGDR